MVNLHVTAVDPAKRVGLGKYLAAFMGGQLFGGIAMLISAAAGMTSAPSMTVVGSLVGAYWATQLFVVDHKRALTINERKRFAGWSTLFTFLAVIAIYTSFILLEGGFSRFLRGIASIPAQVRAEPGAATFIALSTLVPYFVVYWLVGYFGKSSVASLQRAGQRATSGLDSKRR